MEDKIFEMINPEDNTKLSKLNKKELNELLYYINQCIIKYRNVLFIDKTSTFGIEIEYETGGIKKVQEALDELHLGDEWKIKHDGSVSRGGELATPILTNTTQNWETLIHVCNVIKRNAQTGLQAGGHIHVGTNILKLKTINWIKLFYMWMTYEHIMIRFGSGEYIKARNGLKTFAKPVNKRIYDLLSKETIELHALELEPENRSIIEDLIRKYNNQDRYKALNLMKASINESIFENTFEFRCPNATLEEAIWQNNINTLVSFLEHLDKLELEEIKEYFNKVKSCIEYGSLNPNKIYLTQAIELSDLIFDHNIDKVYFLRQYIKEYKTSLSEKKQICLVR